jgi:hypothetical protein
MKRSKPEAPRVFCIGWHKTGTTTLGLALIKLGYSVLGCRLDMVHPLKAGDMDSVLALAGEFDALQDVPWAALYKELDEQYPGSRFILTERDEQNWLRSARRHFRDVEIPLHDWLYGTGRLAGNEELYLNRFRQHNLEVKAYFRDRPEDLLIMNLEKSDDWGSLCSFLGHPIPNAPFPHENKARHRRGLKERLKYTLVEILPSAFRETLLEMKIRSKFKSGMGDPRNRFNNFRENRSERASWNSAERLTNED